MATCGGVPLEPPKSEVPKVMALLPQPGSTGKLTTSHDYYSDHVLRNAGRLGRVVQSRYCVLSHERKESCTTKRSYCSALTVD